jgi:hypothetical protein
LRTSSRRRSSFARDVAVRCTPGALQLLKAFPKAKCGVRIPVKWAEFFCFTVIVAHIEWNHRPTSTGIRSGG